MLATRTSPTLVVACLLATATAGVAHAASVVTIDSAEGLRDGTPSWYQTQFDALTKAAGVKVQYVEGGSAVVADRVAEEKSKPQADILVTLLERIARPSADPVPRPAVGVVPAPTGAYRRRVPAPATREGGEGSWSGTAGPAGPAGGTARS